MEIVLGFVIAVAIAITGVGAGSLTTPLLMLVLGTSTSHSVGSALAFGFIVKLIAAPVYIGRRAVSFRVLAYLLAGGLPGVLLGSFLLSQLERGSFRSQLQTAIGALIACTAAIHLWRMFHGNGGAANRERKRLLSLFAFPIGAEVGFSSAGAGALGSLVLLGCTRLTAAEVVGTDLCFGLALSFVGSAFQLAAGNYDAVLLGKLAIGGIAGAVTGSLLAGRVAQRPMRAALLVTLILLGGELCRTGLVHGHATRVQANRSEPVPVRVAAKQLPAAWLPHRAP